MANTLEHVQTIPNGTSNNIDTILNTNHVQRNTDELKGDESRVAEPNNNERDSGSNTEKTSTKLAELSKPAPNIKTLADLITVCRDRGLQIYNDKQNIPESDKLKALPAYLTNTKVHRSDGVDTTRRGSITSGRRSRRRSTYKPIDSTEFGRIKSSNSQWTSRNSFKSGSESRLRSSPRSTSSCVQSEYSINTEQSYGRLTLHEKVSMDFPDFEGDLEAERVLQMRMRKRSKRHKDTTMSLSDVIKMKQRELERQQRQSISTTTEMDDGRPNHDDEDEEADDIRDTTRTDRPETESGVDMNSNSNEAHGANTRSRSVSSNKERQPVDDQGYESKDTESNSNNEEADAKHPRSVADGKRNSSAVSKHPAPEARVSSTVKRQKSNIGSVNDKHSQKFKDKQGKGIVSRPNTKAGGENQSKVNTVKGEDERNASRAKSRSKITTPHTKSLNDRISNGDNAKGDDSPKTVKANGKANISKTKSQTDEGNKLNAKRESVDDVTNSPDSKAKANISKSKINPGKDDKSKVGNVHSDATQNVTSSNIEDKTTKPQAKTCEDDKSLIDKTIVNINQKTDPNIIAHNNNSKPKHGENDKSDVNIAHGDSEQNIVDANSKAKVTTPMNKDDAVDKSKSNSSDHDGTLSHRSHAKQETVMQGSNSSAPETIVNHENAGKKLDKGSGDNGTKDHDDLKETQVGANSVKQSNEIDTEVQEYVIQDGNTKLVLYKLKTNTSLLESLEKGENNNKQENACDKTAPTAEGNLCHNNSEVIQPETTPISTNMSIDTEKRSPDNSKTNGRINNSKPEDETPDKEALRNVEKTLVPRSSESNGSIKRSNVQSKGSGETNNEVTELESSSTRKTSAKRENAHPTEPEVIKSSIDCEMESNDNKTKSRSVNETGRNGVSDDNGRFKLDTVVNQESISQKHPSDTTRKTETINGVTRMDKTRKQNKPQSNGKQARSVSDSGNETISQASEEKQREKDPTQLDIGGKSSITKRPKRSLGNGFLVSADDGGDKDDVTRDKMDNVPEFNDKDEGADTATAIEHDKETGSLGSRSEMEADNEQPTTSGRQSKASSGSKQLISVAKRAILASKIKQTFDEANNQQNNYVQELGNTRNELWEILRKMKAGEDENEETEELEEDEPTEVPEETASETDDDEEDDTTQEEVPTTCSTTRRKPFVPKRIDNRWDPNHPLYDQIQKGFPSNLKRLETRNVHAALKDLRVEKLDTKQVSNTNVYLMEARRIYPKAFPESEPSDHKTRKANTQPSEPLNSDTMKRYHPEKLDREVTLYGKKYIQRTVNHKQSTGHTPRNVKRIQRPTTGKGTVNKQDTSTLKKATTPRFRPNLRANKVNTEEGKLSKERDKVKYYQDYLENTEAIRAPKSRQSKNKVAPQTSRNPTKGGKTAVHTAKFNSQLQQQHANCVDDDDGDDDDNKDVTHDDTDTGPSVTRETANEKLEPLSSPRSLGSDRRTEDVPISKAVEIVQSRHKFYDNERCEIQTNQRDHRVFKLFREIQMIRRKGDNSDEPEAGMNTSGFLMMDYEFSRSTFSSQKTDGELQRFLRNSLDYEVCVRSRSLQSYPRRRDKALCELRQKLDQPLVYSSNLR